MTVGELKKMIQDVDDGLPITICDLADDRDEYYIFKEIDGFEIVEAERTETKGKERIVAMIIES